MPTSTITTDVMAVTLPTDILIGMVIALLLGTFIVHQFHSSDTAKPPVINKKQRFWGSEAVQQSTFTFQSRRILEEGLKRYPKKAFRILSDTGIVTILPPEVADEIRNDDRFEFRGSNAKLMMAQYPGFEAFRDTGHDVAIWTEVVKTKLSQTIKSITEPMSQECGLPLHDIIGNHTEWQRVALKDTVLKLISRISSRVIVGERLCRDQKWLNITTQYTINAFMAAQDLRLWHPVWRSLVHWFLPRCRLLRQQMAEARAIIVPELERRQIEKGEHHEDTMKWLEEVSKSRKYDPVATQLGLSVGAIHTTGDLITQVLFDLAQHSHLLEPLRAELVAVLGSKRGWDQKAFAELKLLDSVIKESQRLKPLGPVSMRRTVKTKVKLSSGIVLERGEVAYVSSHRMWDANIHVNPLEYNGYRFLEMRQQNDRAAGAQLVSTGPSHLAWGHGQYACPGRFFAANEIKVALAHLLLKYDWKIMENETPTVLNLGFTMNSDPFTGVMFKRRTEEIQL